MNPITPWLDPDEVRLLAEKLLSRQPAPADPRAQEAGFDSTFVGFAPTTPPLQGSFPPPPSPTVAALVAPPPPPSPAPVPSTDPLAAVRGPFLDRISRFRDWLHHHFGASGVFILDREGFVIFDESGHGKLHFLARSLALTSRRPGNPVGNVHVKIGAAATLEVVPVETAYGWLVLGTVVPDPLPPAAVTVIIEALTQVAAPPA